MRQRLCCDKPYSCSRPAVSHPRPRCVLSARASLQAIACSAPRLPPDWRSYAPKRGATDPFWDFLTRHAFTAWTAADTAPNEICSAFVYHPSTLRQWTAFDAKVISFWDQHGSPLPALREIEIDSENGCLRALEFAACVPTIEALKRVTSRSLRPEWTMQGDQPHWQLVRKSIRDLQPAQPAAKTGKMTRVSYVRPFKADFQWVFRRLYCMKVPKMRYTVCMTSHWWTLMHP